MACLTPFTVKNPQTGETFPGDCGQCPNCVNKFASQWAFRLRKEAEASTSAFWLGLTYDTEHVPITKNGFMTLSETDITLWIKRLRKAHWQQYVAKCGFAKEQNIEPPIFRSIKYLYVGEYGSERGRPHYHMFIFNVSAELIEQTYDLGTVHYDTEITGAQVGYSFKYMIKDQKGQRKKHSRDDRIPEFRRQSKGIGFSYITPKIKRYHTDNRAMLERCNLFIDGVRIAMPRYYKDRIYNDWQKDVLKHQAKLTLNKKIQLEQQFDPEQVIEAHKNKFDKMYKNRNKNRTLE